MLRASVPRSPTRRLVAAFVLLLLVPAAAVVWLGVRLVIQDRQLEFFFMGAINRPEIWALENFLPSGN